MMRTSTTGGRQADVHTPVTVVTGFLGSGKTTLLNRALRDPSMSRALIVINEFGEISIDHALTQASSDSIVVLENGCLCCTVFGDLIQTFNRLYHARAAGEIDFDQVVVETSGLAEPAPVVQAFLSDPTLEGLYRVGAIVTTVDAVNGPHTLDEHAVSVAQVAMADRVLITKLDMVAQAERSATRAALTARLRRLNRGARIEAADDAELDVAQLLRRAGPHPSHGPESAKAWLDAGLTGEADRDHAQDHAQAAERGAAGAAVVSPDEGARAAEHHHDPAIASFNLIREEPLPRQALQLLLSSLEQQLGPRLLRVKGLVNVAEEPDQPAVIQGAQHLLHNLTWLERWPDADHRTRIVFITQGIAAEELSEMVNLLERVAERTATVRLRAGAGASAAQH